jgi:hypothetical protein
MADQQKTAAPAAAPMEARGKSKPRSPSYPSLTLEASIRRARAILQLEGRNEATEAVIFSDWGYKSKSGPAIGTLAAVKAFGLLVPGRVANTYRLSELALRIILDEREDDTERRTAIQTAAINPPMHKVLWEKYGAALPSDSNMAYFLRVERQFTDPGAKQFIDLYKATLAFAGLVGDGKLTPPGRDESQVEERQFMATPPLPSGRTSLPSTSPTSGTREIPIPIPGTFWPSIKAAFPMTEEAWKQMLDVLNAMKPGLVMAEPPKDEPKAD